MKRCPLCGNPAKKLTADEVRKIRRSGEAGKVLAKRFRISETLVSYIKNRKSYEWVQDKRGDSTA